VYNSVYQTDKWKISMKSFCITLTSILGYFTLSQVQAQTVFNNGFEQPVIQLTPLNDTGITFAGEYPSGNNVDCTSTTITSPQDCHQGRDFTHNDDTDGHAGFSFTKLDANGTPLADQSVDYATTPWACVQDNVTGLVWEVKTTATGIHNKDNTYQWGGDTAIGKGHPNAQGTYYDPSWNELVQGSNTDNLCGYNNWRVPTVDELSGLANQGTFNPAIDSNYFPNTASSGFWSSSPVASDPNSAWFVFFYDGNGNFSNRVSIFRVRLVRSLGQ